MIVRSRRLQRLQEEIEDELELHLPDIAIEEIDYARSPLVHEGRVSSYGAIVEMPDPDGQLRLPFAGDQAFANVADAATPLDTLRRLADGYSSFVWRQPSASLLIKPTSPDEISLVQFRRNYGVLIVQRTIGGRVRLFSERGIATLETGIWSSRPYASGYATPITRLIELSPGRNSVVRAVLDFSVHVLSPAGVGATLVYPVGATPAQGLGSLDFSHSIVIPSLQVTEPLTHGAIKTLLSQFDRAVVISQEGGVSAVGVELILTEESQHYEAPGGTRHNSACRYSAQEPEALVIVVSADGPVTVFHRGDQLVNDAEALYVLDWEEACLSCNPYGMARYSTGCEECDFTGYQLIERYVQRLRHAEIVDAGDRLVPT